MKTTQQHDRSAWLPFCLAGLLWSLLFSWVFLCTPEHFALLGFLGRRCAAILVVFVVVLVAYLAGNRLLGVIRATPDSLADRAVFGTGLGLGVVSVLTLLLGLAGILQGWQLGGVLVLLAALSYRELRPLARRAAALARRPPQPSWFALLVGGPFVLFLLLSILHSFVPPLDYDTLEYHLGAPAQFFRQGRITFLPYNVYASFPENVEMLYLLGMVLRSSALEGAYVAKLFNVSFALLSALALYALARRFFSARAGKAAAVIFFCSPWLVAVCSVNVYVTAALTFYSVAALYAFLHYWHDGAQARRWLWLCGLMIGLAIGCKYTAILFLLVPLLAAVFLVACLRRVSWADVAKPVGTVLLLALLIPSPWLVKNWCYTRNPTYPLLYSVFGGRNWSEEKEARFRKAHRPGPFALPELGARFWRLAAQGTAVSPTSPLLLLFVPFVVLGVGLKRRSLWFVAVFALSLMAWLHYAYAEDPKPWTVTLAASAVPLVLLALPFLMPKFENVWVLRSLFLYVVLFLILWYGTTHRIDRFLFPAVSVLAVISAYGFSRLCETRWQPIAKALLVVCLGYSLSHALCMTADGLPAALGIEPEEHYLLRATGSSTYCAEAIGYINHELPPTAKVLFVGEAQTFYCERPCLASTVFDTKPLDEVVRGSRTRAEALRWLKEQGFTHIYVNYAELHRLQESYRYEFGGRSILGYSPLMNRGLFTELTEIGLKELRTFREPAPDGRFFWVIYEITG